MSAERAPLLQQDHLTRRPLSSPSCRMAGSVNRSLVGASSLNSRHSNNSKHGANTFLRSSKAGGSPFPHNNSRAGASRPLHLRSCHHNRDGMGSHFHRSFPVHRGIGFWDLSTKGGRGSHFHRSRSLHNKGGVRPYRRNHTSNSGGFG